MNDKRSNKMADGFQAAAVHQPAEVNGAAYRRLGELRWMLEQHDGRS